MLVQMVPQNSLRLQNVGERLMNVLETTSGEGLVVGCNIGRADIERRNWVLRLGTGLHLRALVQLLTAK